jgi:hypothetical protein
MTASATHAPGTPHEVAPGHTITFNWPLGAAVFLRSDPRIKGTVTAYWVNREGAARYEFRHVDDDGRIQEDWLEGGALDASDD